MQAYFELRGLIGSLECFMTVMDKAFTVFEKIAKEDLEKEEKKKKKKGRQ